LGSWFWGQANLKSGDEKETFLNKACEAYARATEINPNTYEAFYSWGGALLDQAKLKSGDDVNQVLDLAEEKLTMALNGAPTDGSYNLACLHALRGQEEACKEWLEKTYKAGELPPCDHITIDIDLDSMREKPWFKEFLVKVGCA
jgi:tetratricopeptide (TPR) repeat protein